MKELKGKAVSGFFWLFSGRIIQHVVNLATIPVLARLLTPREFGIMGAAMLIIDFSAMMSTIGLSPSIVQREDLQSPHIRTANTCGIILGVLFFVIVFFLATPVQHFFEMDGLSVVIQWLSLIFIFQGFGMTPTALTERHMRFRQISFIPWTTKLVYGIISIALALSGWGVFALVAGRVAMVFTNNLFYFILQPVAPDFYFSRKAFNDLFLFGSGMSLNRLVNYFGRQGDFILVGKMLGSDSLGIYGRAFRLMNLPVSFIGQALQNVMVPAMSRVQNENAKLRAAFSQSLNGIMIFALPLSVFSIVMASEIVLVLLGDQWVAAIMPFSVLAYGMFFRVGYKVGISVIAAKGRSYDLFYRQLWQWPWDYFSCIS